MTDKTATPGPWAVRIEKRTRLVCDAHGNQIAAIRPVKRFGIAGDDTANARVLAAAPEAAAACGRASEILFNMVVNGTETVSRAELEEIYRLTAEAWNRATFAG